MVSTPKEPAFDVTMHADRLYREELFTDREAGAIRRLTPVTADGQPDPARPVLYVGQTQLLTTMGSIPLTFEIPAATLAEATGKFGAAAKQAFEQTVRELEEYRRQAASSLVLPDRGAGGFGPGGAPGGGKIRFP